MKSNIMSYLMNVNKVSADCLQRQLEYIQYNVFNS